MCHHAHALTLVISELDQDYLKVRVENIASEKDILLKYEIEKLKGLSSKSGESNSFSLRLDSIPKIAQYLRAARLSGGIYVYLPLICPQNNCTDIQFKFEARKILFGKTIYDGILHVSGIEAKDSSVFFTNEESPRLSSGIYIGPEFSDRSAARLTRSIDQISTEYQRVSGRDLTQQTGVIATTARNSEGVRGFGGDSLNIIRLTFDNPNGLSSDEMVDKFVATYAHEVAHKLQSRQIFELSNSRLISEGSADFLKVLILLRAGVIQPNEATRIIYHAFDECANAREGNDLRQRISTGVAGPREYYDCGMISYFSIFFLSGKAEDVFIQHLLEFLQNPLSNYADKAVNCLFLSGNCSKPEFLEIMGTASSMKAQTLWFRDSWHRWLQNNTSPLNETPTTRDGVVRGSSIRMVE